MRINLRECCCALCTIQSFALAILKFKLKGPINLVCCLSVCFRSGSLYAALPQLLTTTVVFHLHDHRVSVSQETWPHGLGARTQPGHVVTLVE